MRSASLEHAIKLRLHCVALVIQDSVCSLATPGGYIHTDHSLPVAGQNRITRADYVCVTVGILYYAVCTCVSQVSPVLSWLLQKMHPVPATHMVGLVQWKTIHIANHIKD